MMRFLQTNLNHCRAAQDLLCQAMVEKKTDVAIISEPYARSILGNTRWSLDRSGRAALGVINDTFTVSAFEQEDGYIAAKVNGVTVYSCYASPNSPIANFRALLDKLEQSVRLKDGHIIIAGDFNARSAAWMDTTTDARGEELSHLVDTLCLDVVNTGSDPTFVGRGAGSVVDVTFASETLARRVTEWRVLEDENASDHRYIEFQLGSSLHHPDHGESNDQGWIVKDIDPDLLSTGLMLAEWTAIGDTTNMEPEAAATELERGITLACEFAFKAKPQAPQKRRPVPWWNDEIASARSECVRCRRVLTRARRRVRGEAAEEHAEFKEVRKKLNNLIRRSKEKCWADLTKLVENDPWGKPYKIVMRKLQGPPALNRLEPNTLAGVIDRLFPQHLLMTNESHATEEVPVQCSTLGASVRGTSVEQDTGIRSRECTGTAESTEESRVKNRMWVSDNKSRGVQCTGEPATHPISC